MICYYKRGAKHEMNLPHSKYFELYQRHHISNTVHPEGSNRTARRVANQSEMLFFLIMIHIGFV